MTEASSSPHARQNGSDSVTSIRIKRGLDIPIAGAPALMITDGAAVSSVALLGIDHTGLSPSMCVEEGETVKLGQPLFVDRKCPEIVFTSPGCGTVKAINRGARRALQSVVVELSGDDQETFNAWSVDRLPHLRRDQVTETLLASGLWTALRTRPYGKVPDPKTTPSSVFVTAMDSNPLAARPEIVIAARRQDFANGLDVVSHLTTGHVFVCQAPGADMAKPKAETVRNVVFSGPHPSGLAGTHIHYLNPAGANNTVWHIGYQDVIAIGRLFTSGKLDMERVVALAGPGVKRPRLVRTRLGASTDDLTRGELEDAECRIVSGSVLAGHHAQGAVAYLGRFHNQLTVIGDGRAEQPPSRVFPRWRTAFSAYGLGMKDLGKGGTFAPTTERHGAPTALVPLGGFERVMPLDILPTQLIRALLVGDTDMAQALGCLELDEEDMALCSFVCPSKRDYGPLLKACLERIEKEG